MSPGAVGVMCPGAAAASPALQPQLKVAREAAPTPRRSSPWRVARASDREGTIETTEPEHHLGATPGDVAGLQPPATLPRHVVIVATVPMREHLLGRALASVYRQSQRAERVIVVLDGDTERSAAVEARRSTESLRNRRTPGAAGAWNTAIDHLVRSEPDPSCVIVSFLDDDDFWDDDYLDAVRRAMRDGVEVAAAPMLRRDLQSPQGRLRHPPRELSQTELLRGNPGIQGSNLSIRLTALLKAGCFDEALRSCTDRDLCLRLVDLGASYTAIRDTHAIHDTLHGLPRLTDPSGAAKLEGLDAFYSKWRRRMSEADEEAFLRRGRELFHFNPTRTPVHTPLDTRQPQSTASLKIVVGVAVDGSCPQRGFSLVMDLARLAQHPRVDALWLVLVENGDPEGFERVVTSAQQSSLRVYPLRSGQQTALAKSLGLGEAEVGADKSIAASRTLLQPCVGELMKLADATVGWVLDDDARLPESHDLLIDDIVRSREAGFDVVLGLMTDAPPIPHGAALRVQLVDLLHLLAGAAAADPDAAPPAPGPANARWAHQRRDYYYDLARNETDRLESPFLPPIEAPTWRALLLEVGERLPGILRGEQVFRPVTAANGDPIAHARPSYFRGGNTLVFRADLLASVPNFSPLIGGRRARRSDMVWASAVSQLHGATVVAAPIAVRQDRSHDARAAFDARRIHDDIVGYSFARAFHESRSSEVASDPLRLLRKLADERLASLELSVWRVRGVLRSIRGLLESDTWWAREVDLVPFRAGLVATLDVIEREATVPAMGELRQRVTRSLLEIHLDTFRPPTIDEGARDAASHWLGDARALFARRLVSASAEVLGSGREGVVLRQGERVTKVFDLWTRADRARSGPELEALVGEPCEGALPLLLSAEPSGAVFTAVYRYEQSEAYLGGHGAALFRMSRRLLATGRVFTNLHPNNLRVLCDGELQVVDVGRSVCRTTSPKDIEAMVRRAMVVWRWAEHPDLKQLLRRAIGEPELPEAHGWRTLLDALTKPSPKQRLDDLVAAWAGRVEGKVLDLGCGKPGRLARALGERLTATDVDGSLSARWARDTTGASFLSTSELESTLESGPAFAAATCSLVLCVNEREGASMLLRRMRRAVGVGGRVLVAVCDPTSIAVRETTYQTRSGATEYEREGEVHKCVHSTRSCRAEIHRPLDLYRRMFARAAMSIVAERIVHDVDVDRFDRVGAFVVFELVVLEEPPPATLLIKLCAMEATTVAAQVRHLVTALGSPRSFDEVVAVVDPFDGPFARQHATGSLSLLREEVGRLQAEGWIDRIHEPDLSSAALGELSARWFGIESGASRAQNGQPVAAFLSALDACRTDLVLHVDADVVVARRPDCDPIDHAQRVFDAHPHAITLALPARGAPLEMTAGDPSAPHRVEVTGGWIKRSRLERLLPLPNKTVASRWEVPWHRALDARLRGVPRTSLRCGSASHWYATIDNAHKVRSSDHLLLLDRVEAGHAPDDAPGWPMVLGPLEAWLGPKRGEAVVVVVIGRNVGPGRVHRCLDSVRAQTFGDLGLVVIDDASDNGVQEVIAQDLRSMPIPTMYIRRRLPVGLLENTSLAVRELVAGDDTVVVLLDLDDALASPSAVQQIAAAHAQGADVVVGSMLRTDRPGTTYRADFTDPRGNRGGNVWQHPRSFRRRLFARIDARDLLDSGGEPFAIATDWAFMLPIVEMAEAPAHIATPLYLHEPGAPRTPERRAERESVIATIISRRRYPRRSGLAERAASIPVLSYHRVLPRIGTHLDALYARRGLVVELSVLEQQLRQLLATRRALSLGTYQEILRGERGDPGPAFVVTFDDGYRDFAEHAWPLLRRMGVPCALFARAPRGDGLPSWAPLDLLYHVLCAGSGPLPSRDEVRALRAELLGAPLREQPERILALARDRGVRVDPSWRRALYADASELSALTRACGITVGSHGTHHVRAASTTQEALRDGLDESLSWLETLEQAGPKLFAYPDGDDSYASEVEARFSLGFGLDRASGQDRGSLRRVMVPNDPSWAGTLEAVWERT
jgi:glycosyltransferase involved in cell wall biosynthesis/peptidoglycan/xylan/chitin deacetylase (PgdA/CDA1 family)